MSLDQSGRKKGTMMNWKEWVVMDKHKPKILSLVLFPVGAIHSFLDSEPHGGSFWHCTWTYMTILNWVWQLEIS